MDAGVGTEAGVAAPEKLDYISDKRFEEAVLTEATKRAMAQGFRFEFMTQVQAQAVPEAAAGKDVLARALTGTGKTLGFLIPAVEKMAVQRPSPDDISALVLCPTRELAAQIMAEATTLLGFHQLGAQMVVGGTNMGSEERRLRGQRCDVLVATPGRLTDHLKNTSGFKERVRRSLRTLVLDEADQMLEMGFKPAIDEILTFLPEPARRQTMLFSATVPKELLEMVPRVLRPGHVYVDTIGETQSQTHEHVDQSVLVVPQAEVLPHLFEVISAQRRVARYKIIVFLNTARMAQMMAETFNAAGVPALEIHSRKSQAQRTRVSEDFRTGSSKIMFSSDVSARGMDYPDVTCVVQVGVPTDRQQYVHRLGRTARAGRGGRGILILADFEAYFLNMVKDLNVRPESNAFVVSNESRAAVSRGLSRVPDQTKAMAYGAWLGFYNSQRRIGWSKPELVARANDFATCPTGLGCQSVPFLQAKTVGKMGLKGIPGLNVLKGPSGNNNRRQ